MITKDMLTKFSRMLYLLGELDKGSIIPSQAAKEIGVDVRTIYRYLEDLETAKFPLTQDKHGRYRFVETFSLKKLPLSVKDQVLLGLMEQLAASLGSTWKASFLHLKQNAINPQIRAQAYFVKMPRMWHTLDHSILDTLEQAILQKCCLDVYYESSVGKVAWSYKVRPLKIALFDGFWYLITLNSKGRFMKFSLGQIKKATLRPNDKFEYEDIEPILQKAPNVWFDDKQKINITLHVDKEVARYFKEVEFFPFQTIKRTEKDGSLVVTCRTAHFMQVLPVVKRWLPHVTVQKPVALKKALADDLKKFLENEK
jgi:predicted DNA-binding transcriptional regulator YafY